MCILSSSSVLYKVKVILQEDKLCQRRKVLTAAPWHSLCLPLASSCLTCSLSPSLTVPFVQVGSCFTEYFERESFWPDECKHSTSQALGKAERDSVWLAVCNQAVSVRAALCLAQNSTLNVPTLLPLYPGFRFSWFLLLTVNSSSKIINGKVQKYAVCNVYMCCYERHDEKCTISLYPTGDASHSFVPCAQVVFTAYSLVAW